MIVTLTLNGDSRSVEIDGHESLLRMLREQLDAPGAKSACEQGECGSCTVVMDEDIVCSCLVLAADAEGAVVTTVEGLGTPERLHPVQQAFVDHGAVQCGFCTPGLIVAAAHLFATEAAPAQDRIREALAGNLCRCTGYGAIERALQSLIDEGAT